MKTFRILFHLAGPEPDDPVQSLGYIDVDANTAQEAQARAVLSGQCNTWHIAHVYQLSYKRAEPK
jgi:hypothetical protein